MNNYRVLRHVTRNGGEELIYFTIEREYAWSRYLPFVMFWSKMSYHYTRSNDYTDIVLTVKSFKTKLEAYLQVQYYIGQESSGNEVVNYVPPIFSTVVGLYLNK